MNNDFQSPGGETDADHKLEEALGMYHREIVGQVEGTIAVAERGVLEAGQLLGEIVHDALAQGNETSEILRGDAAGSVLQELENEATSAEDHIAVLDKILGDLASRANQALQAVCEISQTVSGFQEVLMSTRIVGISLRIEVAWLRAEDGLGVVGDQLKELTAEIETLSGDVARLTSSLGAILPALKTSMTRVGQARDVVHLQVSSIVADLQQVAKTFARAAETTASAGGQSASTIHLRCEEALSRLQFFDPMTQDLQRLDVLISEFRATTAKGSGAQDIGPIRFGKRLGDAIAEGGAGDAPAAGEVMLF